MNTEHLHKKIERFNSSPNLQFAEEIIKDLSEWISVMERVNSDEGWDNHLISFEKMRQDEFIELLIDMLVITGNADKLAVMRILDREKMKNAVDFLLKNKDRSNHRNIYTIAVLLDLAAKQGKKIETLVELVNYAKSGN